MTKGMTASRRASAITTKIHGRADLDKPPLSALTSTPPEAAKLPSRVPSLNNYARAIQDSKPNGLAQEQDKVGFQKVTEFGFGAYRLTTFLACEGSSLLDQAMMDGIKREFQTIRNAQLVKNIV
jgi:hypothetical protein